MLEPVISSCEAMEPDFCRANVENMHFWVKSMLKQYHFVAPMKVASLKGHQVSPPMSNVREFHPVMGSLRNTFSLSDSKSK